MRPVRLVSPSLVALAWLALTAPPLAAQTQTAAVAVAASVTTGSKIWIDRHAEIEEYLKSAVIEREEAVPVGVTKPMRCYLAPGGPVQSIVWKPLPPGRHRGFWDSYKAEIAAYALDKMLGLNMVPTAVERRHEGNLGAAVMWVEDTRVWKISEPIRGPDPVAWDRQVIRMKMYDNLIGNTDRNQGNLLVDSAYNLILIDHSRGFTAGKKLMTTLSRVDPEFWERIQALTLEQLQERLGQWIDKGQIRDILARRDAMQKAIDRLVKEKGEAAYLR